MMPPARKPTPTSSAKLGAWRYCCSSERTSASQLWRRKAAPRSFEMALQDQMVYAFVHLLEVAIASAQWSEPAAGASASPAGAHDGEKPQYLN